MTTRSSAALLCALLALMCAAQQDSSSHENRSTPVRAFTPTDAQHILAGSCELMPTTAQFPESLKSAFARLTRQNRFALANPGDAYQETDVIKRQELPSRRLIVAGKCQSFWFIHYEQGGIGHDYALVFFRADSHSRLSFVWGGRGFTRAGTVAKLRGAIAAKLFSDDRSYYW